MTTLTLPADDSTHITTADAPSRKETQPPQGYLVPARSVSLKIAHYPTDAQRHIMAFAGVLRLTGWTLGEAAARLAHVGTRSKHKGDGGAVDKSTLSQILNGKYPSPERLALTLGAFAEQWQREQLTRGRRLVPTRMVKAVAEVCRAAADWHKPAFIWGKTQEGKTTGLEHFAASRPGVIYYRTPASVSYLTGVRELIKVAGATPGKTVERARTELWSSITREHVLIVDELHQVFTTWPQGAALKFWETLRDLWDAKKCALVLCGTSEIAKQMSSGAFSELLKQLKERTQLRLSTDDAPSLAVGTNTGTINDINAVLASYGMAPLAVTAKSGKLNGDPEDARRFAYFRDRILSHSMGDIFGTLDRAAEIAGPGRPDFTHLDRAIAELASLGISL